MTDNNDDNIVGMPLPLHKRWRDRLPEHYAKHVEALKSYYDQVRAMRRSLDAIRYKLGEGVVQHAVDNIHLASRNFDSYPGRQRDREVLTAQQHITDALVLLACAEEKLMHALPVEVWMPVDELAKYERERGK